MAGAAGAPLRFADDIGQKRYALLELDDRLLETISAGGVVIKGEAGDEACLCTPTHTYLMRLAESSNTHYLLPGSLACGEPLGAVAASVNTYYELKPTVPRLLKLRSLLSKRTYEGFDEAREEGAAEAEPPAKRLTTSSLRAAVQCSDAQLIDALDVMHAVQLEGEWRLLGSKYRHQITEYILTLVDQNDWPRGSVSVREVLRQSAADFPDFAPQAVRHCLRHLSGQPRPRGLEPDAADAELTAALDERKVSLFYAEAMLAERERWRKDDFLVGWRAVAPDGVELDLLMLRGMAVEVEVGKERYVQWLPAGGGLPAGVKERLASLFAVKPSWRLEEIGVYLDDVLEQEVGYTKEQILIQHACQMKDAAGATVFQKRQ